MMKKTYLLFFLSLAICLNVGAQKDSQPKDSIPKTALVLIDIQDFYFDTTKAPLVGRYEAGEQSAAILSYFRKTQQEVVHIRHKGGGDIQEMVKPLPGETVFEKEHVSCFRETPLLEYLQEKEVERLVIVGMMTHMCVEATVRAASDYGFKCIVISDGCTTRDLKFNGKIINKFQILRRSCVDKNRAGIAKNN